MSDPGKASDLLAQIPKGEGKGLPPVHLWNPDFCGDIDMEIRADGTWAGLYRKWLSVLGPVPAPPIARYSDRL